MGAADTVSPRDGQCPRGELSVDGTRVEEGEVSLPSLSQGFCSQAPASLPVHPKYKSRLNIECDYSFKCNYLSNKVTLEFKFRIITLSAIKICSSKIKLNPNKV